MRGHADLCINIRAATRAIRQIRLASGLLVFGGSGETYRVPLLAVRRRDHLGGVGGPSVYQLASGAVGGGFVLLNDARRDAPTVADRDTVVFRPGPDIAAALTA